MRTGRSDLEVNSHSLILIYLSADIRWAEALEATSITNRPAVSYQHLDFHDSRPLYHLDSALFCLLARHCLHLRYKHPDKREKQRKKTTMTNNAMPC